MLFLKSIILTEKIKAHIIPIKTIISIDSSEALNNRKTTTITTIAAQINIKILMQ